MRTRHITPTATTAAVPRARSSNSVLTLVGVLAFFVSGAVQAEETRAFIEARSSGVPAGYRVRLEMLPRFRVLGIRPAGIDSATGRPAAEALETRFEGPAQKALSVELISEEPAASHTAEASFPFDASSVMGAPGPHVAFLRLVGSWEVAAPTADPAKWRVLAGRSFDWEVPALEEHLSSPGACVTISRQEEGAYDVLITDSCGPTPGSSTAAQ